MKTYVKMTKPQYIVNEKAGIVVCKITAYTRIVKMSFMFNSINLYSSDAIPNKYHFDYIDEEKNFTAIAKLSPNDTWDEVIGRRIAESKCKQKIYKFYSRVYSDVFKRFYQELKQLDDVIDTTNYAYKRETEHLKELIK